MPYIALNAEPVGTEWNNKNTYESSEDIEKIDINVIGNVDVQIQWLEGDQKGYTNEQSQFVLLRPGFHSIPFATPIKRFRLRQWPQGKNFGGKGEVDIREYM